MQIDVVIPTVDRAELLRGAIEGVFCQEPLPGEICIVIVDNSVDGGQRAIVDALTLPAPMRLLYVHEPRPGLAYARNAGVAASHGDFVVFLDDDEAPVAPDWLDQLASVVVRSGADVVFGPVVPQFEFVPESFEAFVTGLYSRRLGEPDGADISERLAHLGTGNSCFRRATCLEGAQLFRHDFDHTGGEDIDFLHQLRQRGRRFAWAARAPVKEFVPRSRVDVAYLSDRRFRQGQQRAHLQISSLPARYDRLMFWMLVGALQSVYHTFGMLGAALLGKKQIARRHGVQLRGGLGKILWQKRYRHASYREIGNSP